MAPKSSPPLLRLMINMVPLTILLFVTITTQPAALISAKEAGESGSPAFARTIPHGANHLSKLKEKLTHFRVYWHDVQSGPNPTSVPIIKPNSSAGGFGWTNVIDNPLTETPDLKSKLVGRAQGFYSMDSQEEVGLIMAMNFVFVEGKYNGSTITVLGRNMVLHKVREMPVVGGTGLFRFARGYVEARTHTFDPKTGDACVEYNCFVMHY